MSKGSKPFTQALPSAAQLPQGAGPHGLTLLVSSLGVLAVVQVFTHLLLEGQVILYSEQVGKLTPVAEALRSLLFPFQWPCVFVPILPQRLSRVTRYCQQRPHKLR